MGAKGDHPKSQRQKRILDIAEAQPESSVETIASEVPTASPETVERVLDSYGDPADTSPTKENESETAGESESAVTDDSAEVTATTNPTASSAEGAMNSTTDSTDKQEAAGGEENSAYPSLEELSERQREVVEAVATDPGATQREIGEQLGISGATVSNRASNIPAFDWSNREEFIKTVVGSKQAATPAADGGSTTDSTNTQDSSEAVTDRVIGDNAPEFTVSLEEIQDDIAELKTAVDEIQECDGTDSSSTTVSTDTDLVHKIVHACMAADTISEDEELRIIDELLN